MPVDGYLNFDTKIDTDGFKDGVKDVESHAESFGAIMNGMAQKVSEVFQTAAEDAVASITIISAQLIKTFKNIEKASSSSASTIPTAFKSAAGESAVNVASTSNAIKSAATQTFNKVKDVVAEASNHIATSTKKIVQHFGETQTSMVALSETAVSMRRVPIDLDALFGNATQSTVNYSNEAKKAEKTQRSFAKSVKETKPALDSQNNAISNLTSSFKHHSSFLSKMLSAMLIVNYGKAFLDNAADVKAAGSQFEQTFGEMQDAAEAAIDRVAEPADILAERLRGSATQIYAFAKTAKMESTTSLTFMEDALTVAADSAAYYDRSIEKTTETLQSFLKGNYENDAALGLSATETTRNAKAMELYGKSFNALTEAQKQLTLLEMVKDANRLSGAMGQAAREADGWANVTGNLSEVWHQFLGVIGQPVLALAVPVVQHMTAALEKMTAWASAAYTALAKVFGWEQKQVKPIEQATTAQGDLTAAVEETNAAQEGSLASFDEIEILASDAAEATEKSVEAAQIAVGTEVQAVPEEAQEVDTSWIDTFTAKLQGLKEFLDTNVKPALSTVGESLKLGFEGFSEFLDKNVKPALATAGESLKAGFADFGDFLDANVKPALATVGETLKNGFADFGNVIDTDVKPQLSEVAKNHEISFTVNPPEGLTEMFEPIGEWFRVKLPEMVQTAILAVLPSLDPLAKWFTTDLPEFITSGVEFAATAVSGLLDTFSTVFNDIMTSVVSPFLSSFTESILPVFTQLGTQLFEALGVAFKEVKRAFDMVWKDGIKPVLDLIGEAWQDFWKLVQNKWEQWGEPIFKKLKEAFEKTGDTFETIWKNYIQPVWDTFMKVVNELWDNHLKPFISNFLDLIGTIVDGALDIYNKFILPVIGWIGEKLGPAWAKIKSIIIETVGAILGNLIDFGSSVIDNFKAIINFIVGVFTGDWERAWKGIQDYFASIWDGAKNLLFAAINAIIGFLNGMIEGVVDGFNTVIRALNRIQVKIPDWVPMFGGESFGVNLRTITAPRIPYLASGAVIPPNREFLAVLGDQTHGTNVEAPLETILEAMRTALRENGGGHGQQTIILQIDRRELGRVVLEVGSEEEQRVGLKLVTA